MPPSRNTITTHTLLIELVMWWSQFVTVIVQVCCQNQSQAQPQHLQLPAALEDASMVAATTPLATGHCTVRHSQTTPLSMATACAERYA